MIHSESKTKAMGKKSNNINKYRMQFHLENKSLSIASSWVDCQQNLNRSLEKCHSALTHKHKRTHHTDLQLCTIQYTQYCNARARGVQNIYNSISESSDARRTFNKIRRKISENS